MSQRLRTGILIAVLGLAIIVIGFFVLTRLIRQSLAPLPAPSPEAPETLNVVVTTHDIALGTVLKAEDLRTAEMPLALVPPNAIQNIETAVGLFAKIDLVSGEMILTHHLANPTNVNHDVGYSIDNSQVLMAFPASDLMSTLSIIQRGDIVDLFVTLEQAVETAKEGEEDVTVTTGEEEATVKTLTFDAFQRVEITAMVVDIVTEEQRQSAVPLDTGGTPQPQPTPRPSQVKIRAYLLALQPQDALVLKHLKDIGATFDMVLRNPTSNQLFELSPVTEDYLIDRYQLELPK